MRAHNLSDRDYELLSAYMDGQLAPGEKQKLEERLNARPEMASALDEMQRTRMLLRQAPKRRAPRNFTITPAMLEKMEPKRSQNKGWTFNLFPAFGFASALAALLLVATIVFQLTAGGQAPQTIAMGGNPAADQSAEQYRTANDTTGQAGPTQAALAAPQAPAAAEPAQQKAAVNQPTATAEAATSQPALAAEPMATATQEMPAQSEQPAATQAPATEATAAAATGPSAGAALNPNAAPSPTESGFIVQGESPTFEGAQPRPTFEPFITPSPEVTPVEPAQGSQPAENPIIIWNNLDGRGGGGGGGGGGGAATGMGGGGGQGPSLGPLMGPPAAPAANSGPVPSYSGKEGVPSYGNLVIPPEAANSLDKSNVTPQTPAQANNNITGGGPILGAAPKNEGGQIIDRKAILGNTDGARETASTAPVSQPPAPARWPWLPAAQIALAVIAVLSGAAAYVLRHRARG